MLQRKHQGDIDIDPFAGQLLDRGNALGRGGNLDHQIGPLHGLPQPPRFSDAASGIVSELRRDFKADIAVSAVRFVIHGPQHIGRHADIFDGYRLKQCFVGLFIVGFEQFAQRIIVTIAASNGLLKNGWIAGQAAQLVFSYKPLQFSAIDEVTADRVQPNRLAALQ